MVDTRKTKAQLIEELKALREYAADLKAKGNGTEAEAENASRGCMPRQKRVELQTDIEFIGDFDIVRAKGVDLSEGGICFEVSEALPFEMQFELEGEKHRHRAHLVWMKRLRNGGYRFGFRFVPSESYPVI